MCYGKLKTPHRKGFIHEVNIFCKLEIMPPHVSFNDDGNCSVLAVKPATVQAKASDYTQDTEGWLKLVRKSERLNKIQFYIRKS